jgi:hypothetical protein
MSDILADIRAREDELMAAQAAGQAAAPAPALATVERILDDFIVMLHCRGVAGEDRFAKLVYLCITTRVLDHPVSVAAKGPSSAGKSYIVQEVLNFFPASAYHALTGMSEHAMAYSKEPLSHRFLIVYEAVGLEGDFASYLIRSLLSEGCIRYETVIKAKGGGMQPLLIEREGPTGLIVTTTAVHLHPENETRLLSVTANDTREQTKHVMRALACESGRTTVAELADWHALQEWIGEQDNRVSIPFAADLAELVPPVAVRLRRDFLTVLNLIRAHAVLHQASRERDDGGCVVAAVADYAAVRELVADLIADEVDATVPPIVRDTVAAVEALQQSHEHGVTYLMLSEHLKLDKSSAMRRARVAMAGGYLKNLETRRGQSAKLVLDETLPTDAVILPQPEELSGCAVARPQRSDRP